MRLPSVLFVAAVCAMAQSHGGGGAGGGMPGRGMQGGGMPGRGMQGGGMPGRGMQGGGMPGRGMQGGGMPGARLQGSPFLPPPLFNPFPFPTFAEQLTATVNGWPPPRPGFGATRFRGSWNNGSFGGAFPLFVGGGYYGGGGFNGGGGYYPPNANPPEPANVTVVLPPQRPAPLVVHPDAGMAAPPPEAASVAPPPQSVVPTEFPALISLKDGWTYSATTYWTKGTTFHFITTQGEHIQVPVSRLARVYPAQKDGYSVGPVPPAR
jgi:hypothetical protein